MLLPARLHDAIVAGEVTCAFRRWKRPTVRSGGTLRYPRGVLAIDEVARIDLDAVTDADARTAGAADRAEVLAELDRHEGEPYRIRFHHLGDDPRAALREHDDLDDAEVADLDTRLARMDARSRRGPWTRATLELLASRPGVVARELAATQEVDRDVFKRDVRKLKELGLTRSLDVGYELSPRGRAYLDRTAP
ncbi:hypothetical protein FTX61_12580 [Nitriliruptoraceae bacterium ZYF776]|nr:hypothetical protein [Profundirhabdus halotolerans]